MPTGTEPPPGPWARAVALALSDVMTAADVSQRTLASRMDLHASTLSRILAGRRALTLDEVARAAAALDITPTTLVLRGQRLLAGGAAITGDSPDAA